LLIPPKLEIILFAGGDSHPRRLRQSIHNVTIKTVNQILSYRTPLLF